MCPRNLERVADFAHGGEVVQTRFSSRAEVQGAEFIDNHRNLILDSPFLGLQNFSHDGFLATGLIVVSDGVFHVGLGALGNTEVAGDC